MSGGKPGSSAKLAAPSRRSFYIWGFLQDFFSFNPGSINLVDLTYDKIIAKLWNSHGGRACSLGTVVKPVFSSEINLYASVADLNCGEPKLGAIIVDRMNQDKRKNEKNLQAAWELAERVEYLIINDPPEKVGELPPRVQDLGFYPVKETQDDFLQVNLTIYAKGAAKYAKIAGAYEVGQVISLEGSTWYRVKTCVKGKENLYLKLDSTSAERQSYMKSCFCRHVPPAIDIGSNMMVLADVGALPLRFLSDYRSFNRELVYREAESALVELHNHDIIHGNISKDTIWVNPDDSSAWIMCFDHAIINGEGWLPFHQARWGKARTSKIDFQGLLEAFTQ